MMCMLKVHNILVNTVQTTKMNTKICNYTYIYNPNPNPNPIYTSNTLDHIQQQVRT